MFKKKPPVECICINCKIQFNIPYAWYKRGQGKYCSTICVGLLLKSQGKWKGKNNPKFGSKRTGSLNPNYKGGISSFRKTIYNSEEWKNWRQSVFKRDDYTCQICFKKGNINLHSNHIKKFSDYPALRFITTNGVTLCQDCHVKKVNGKEVKWEDYFYLNFYYRGI